MDIHTINSTSVLSRCMRFIGAIVAIALMMPAVAFSQTYSNPTPVPLLTAGTYGALAYSGITGAATVNGDGGTSTATIAGTITFNGTNWGVGGAHNTQAQTDLAAALTNANGRTNNLTIADALAGQILQRGVYTGGALDLASGTTLTLDALNDPTAVFIIRAASTLTINTNSTVSLANGAVWTNVFWYVGSSATINGGGSTFNGIILAVTSITLTTGSTVTAQLLANGGAVTINSSVLPVELTSFTAAVNNNVVELNWNTATEVNNYGFEIERLAISDKLLANSQKLNANSWSKIGFVQGHGNSNSPKEYSFVDKYFNGGKILYRLKQIDFDGAFEYSDVVEVEVEALKKFAVYQNYPNPFNPTTYISYDIPVKSNVVIKVYNVLGSEVVALVNEEKLPGRYLVEFNAPHLPSGIYFYSINAGEYKSIKKMILLK